MKIAIAWKTPLGFIAMVGQPEWLERIFVGYHSFEEVGRTLKEADADLLETAPNAIWKSCQKRLTEFTQGKSVDFSDFPLDLSYLGPFQAKVVAVCRKLPRGKVVSYQELAAKAGSPRAFRAAGTTMSSNRFPLVIPCHRVIASGGKLGGYSAPHGLDFKRKLLALEEVDLESLKAQSKTAKVKSRAKPVKA